VSQSVLKRVRTPVLGIAYEESGPADGAPVLLMHGFPYDPRAYDEVVPLLVAAGCRVIVPYLRGYGPTRFFSADTPRSGQQAALGKDLLDLLDALDIERAALAGYDWGGRAACIVAALWPQRVRCLVSGGGYNIQNIADAAKPSSAEHEHRLWYQYYFHTERGRRGLTENRRDICRLLWRLWSPNFSFDDATYERTAASFDNPDFRRCGDPVVPPSLRLRAGRPGARADRTGAGGAAEDYGADDRVAWRGFGDRSAQAVRAACAVFHRALSAPGHSRGRPLSAGGSAA
jgi:pimeloyl-ACP methyl ester carboxylesterase